MTQAARRVYYLSAFLIFAIVGPLLVAWTAGYRWSGNRSGFIRTGSLLITSEPRATIHLNGEYQGTTPWRATHLNPGRYVIELSKTGLQSWRQDILITANNALTIGPVMLYPDQFSINSLVTESQNLMATPDSTAIFMLTNVDDQWSARQIWPTMASNIVNLPWLPEKVAASRTGQTLIWQNQTQSYVTFKNQPTDSWVVDAITQPIFDPSSEAVFFDRQGQRVIRYDGFAREKTEVAVADSYSLMNDTLWLTQSGPEVTTLLRQPSFGLHVPSSLLTLPGRWAFVTGPPGTLLVHNQDTRELATISQIFGTEQFKATAIGTADEWWWDNAGHPPLWLNGSDLMTLNEKKVPTLLDRLTATPNEVAWLVPGHILLTQVADRISFTSVSLNQGRGILMEQVFNQPSVLIGLDIPNRRAVITTNEGTPKVTELGW